MAAILQRFHAMDLELLPEDYYYASILELLGNTNAHNPSAYYNYFFEYEPFSGELYFAIENIDADEEKELIVKMPKFQIEGQFQDKYMIFQYSARDEYEFWEDREMMHVYNGELIIYQNGTMIEKDRYNNESLLINFYHDGMISFLERLEIPDGVLQQHHLDILAGYAEGTEEVQLKWKRLSKDNIVLAFNPELEETKILDNQLPWQMYMNTFCGEGDNIWRYLNEYFHEIMYTGNDLEKSDIFKLLPSGEFEEGDGDYIGKISKKELEKLSYDLNLKMTSLPEGSKELPGGVVETYLGFISTDYHYNFIVLNTEWEGNFLQIEGICNHYDAEIGMSSYKISITLEKDASSVMYGFRVVDSKSEQMEVHLVKW